MEIHRLKRDQINDAAWDLCIHQHANGLPYALTIYLDVVTGGQWEGLMANNYQYVFPLPFEKKLGLYFFTQPFLSQQLGLFGPEVDTEKIQLFLNEIPKNASLINYKLNEIFSPEHINGYNIKPRTNLLLDLNSNYENIQKNYSKSLRKRIRQARSHYGHKIFNDPKKIVNFYQKQLEHRVQLGGQKYKLAQKLMEKLIAEDLGFGIAATTQKGKMEACLFLIKNKGRLINLFGASNDKGKDHYAMHFLLDLVIESNAEKMRYLDFEGSDIPGVQAFYKSFGSVEKNYTEVTRNNIPKWFRFLQTIKNKL